MDMTLSRFKHRAEAAEGFVDDLMQRHDEAMKVRECESVLAECIDMSNYMAESVTAILRDFLTDSPDQPDFDERLYIAALADRGIRAFHGVLLDGIKHKLNSYSVDRYDEAVAVLDRLSRAVAKLKSTCPDPDESRILRASEEAARGDFISEDEVFSDAGIACS